MLTVKDLLDYCMQEVADGNGDKVVYISNDDEGNGFHGLYYAFTTDPEDIRGYVDGSHSRMNNVDIDSIILLG